MASFGELYEYSSSTGVVIPQTSSIKENVEQAFKDIFGSDFSLDPTTTNGRLIEAITMLFVDTCGVTAQNLNQMNVMQAVGSFLDRLGAMFGVPRLQDESDAAYKKRIVQSASRGSGFARSIRQAIGNVYGVTGVVVLDNGNENPDALPKDEEGNSLPNSISVDPHSVFICVHGGNNADIAAAIKATKSAGCGYTDSPEYGTPTVQSIVDAHTGSSFTAVFYRPSERYVKVSAVVVNGAYSGTNIVADATTRVRTLLSEKKMNATITKSEIVAAVASGGSGIIADDIVFKVSDTDSTLATGETVDEIVVMPYMFISPEDAIVDIAEA